MIIRRITSELNELLDSNLMYPQESSILADVIARKKAKASFR
jgi:hypothetical protein